MSLEVHCGTVMDHITGKMHCTSEPGRTACWMHNSLSQNTQYQLPAQCVYVCVCSRASGYSYGNIWECNYKSQCQAKVNHYSCEEQRWNCSGAAGVMNEIFAASVQSGESLKLSVVNTMRCLLQELGYQALLLYTNTVLLELWEDAFNGTRV